MYRHQMDKLRLIDHMQMEAAFFERTIAGLTPQQMEIGALPGGWSVNDVIGHMSDWLLLMLDWIEKAEQGKTPDRLPGTYTDELLDEVNAAMIAVRKGGNLDDNLKEYRGLVGKALKMVQALPEEKLLRVQPGGILEKPYGLYIQYNTGDHYHDHTVDVRKCWRM